MILSRKQMYKYLQRQLKHYFDDLACLNRVPGALGREQAAYMQGQILLTSRQIFSTHKRINKSVSKRQLSDKVGMWFLLILQDASLDRLLCNTVSKTKSMQGKKQTEAIYWTCRDRVVCIHGMKIFFLTV